MTAPLEVLRGLSDAMESAHDYLPVTALTIRAAIAAIEERDAEIEKARREVRRTASRLQRTHRNAARFADDAAKATARFKAAVKRALQDSEKIATLTRQLAEANEENDRVWEQLRAVDDTLNALGCSQAETFTRSAAIQGIADEREKWLTASRVLCAAHVGVPQPTCPVCALTTATAQRDAMRGALEEIRDHGYFEDLIGRALGAL